MALAPGDLKEGSPAWMRQVVKEHGSTKPLQIEARRAAMSAKCTILERQIINLQSLKKAAKVENEKTIRETEKKTKSEADSVKQIAMEQHLMAMQFQAKQQEAQFDSMIADATVKFLTIEGLCLIIDSLTIRVKVKSKSGKEGFKRFSVAGFLSDVGLDTQYIPGMFKLYKRQQFPLGIPEEDDPDSEKFEEEAFEDDDVLSDDEKAKIESVEGE